jgi:hypothetical protein
MTKRFTPCISLSDQTYHIEEPKRTSMNSMQHHSGQRAGETRPHRANTLRLAIGRRAFNWAVSCFRNLQPRRAACGIAPSERSPSPNCRDRVPRSPRRLIQAACSYGKAGDWVDFTVVDGRFITGQNPASSGSSARELQKLLLDSTGRRGLPCQAGPSAFCTLIHIP